MARNKTDKLKTEDIEMNKKYYTNPKMDVKKFDEENIVTDSVKPQSLKTEGVNLGGTRKLFE